MKAINVKLNDNAHRVIRKLRIDGGLTTQRIIELALAKLDADLQVVAPTKPAELSPEAV